eukprot:SAG11_NODE_2671_length_3110_cov_3.724012_1_plen_204_part_00
MFRDGNMDFGNMGGMYPGMGGAPKKKKKEVKVPAWRKGLKAGQIAEFEDLAKQFGSGRLSKNTLKQARIAAESAEYYVKVMERTVGTTCATAIPHHRPHPRSGARDGVTDVIKTCADCSSSAVQATRGRNAKGSRVWSRARTSSPRSGRNSRAGSVFWCASTSRRTQELGQPPLSAAASLYCRRLPLPATQAHVCRPHSSAPF